jgi:hypothetical protein
MALRATTRLVQTQILKKSVAGVGPVASRFMSEMSFTFAAPNGVHYKVKNGTFRISWLPAYLQSTEGTCQWLV